jgi:hypothetical protein
MNIFRKYKRFALLALSILSLVVLIGCGAAKGIYAVATGLDEGITVKRELGAQKLITPEVELSMTRGMLDVDRIFIQVTDRALCFEHFTTDVKTALLTSVDQSLTSIDRLNEQGVLHIKSESSRKRYEQWMSRLRLSAIGIRTALVLIPANDPVEGQPAPQLTAKQQRELDNLRDWCKRASTLLKQNETRLQEDLVRLGASESSAPTIVQ